MDLEELIRALNTLQTLGINLPNLGLSKEPDKSKQSVLVDSALNQTENNSSLVDLTKNEKAQVQIQTDTSGRNPTVEVRSSQQTGIEPLEEIRVLSNNEAQPHAALNARVTESDGHTGVGKKSFLDAVNGDGSSTGVPMNLTPIRVEGGNVIVEVDEEEIEKESVNCAYDVIGRVTYQKGDKPFSHAELQTKLQTLWKLPRVEIAHMGKGFYHVFLRNSDHQSSVMSKGTLSLKPGFFRVSRWVKDFNPHNQKQTNAQCWIRIYDLPMEYRGSINLMNIARGAGMPLKVDPKTQRTGPYARVQVDVDCSRDLPEKILIKRKKAGFDFFANLFYEFVPFFCQTCRTIGHKTEACRMTAPRGHGYDDNNRGDNRKSVTQLVRTQTITPKMGEEQNNKTRSENGADIAAPARSSWAAEVEEHDANAVRNSLSGAQNPESSVVPETVQSSGDIDNNRQDQERSEETSAPHTDVVPADSNVEGNAQSNCSTSDSEGEGQDGFTTVKSKKKRKKDRQNVSTEIAVELDTPAHNLRSKGTVNDIQ